MKGRAVAVLCGLLIAGCSARQPRTLAGYNVLLVTVDTTRADHIGAYGAKGVETPNIDSLAARGVRFDEAISNVPLTLPSHCTILSGLLPLHHGIRNNGASRFPATKETLATALSRRGYRTGAFVGSFVLNRRFGLDRGFDVYDDAIDSSSVAANGLEAERTGNIVVDRALDWLSKPDARPFFAWVHLYDPHAPYAPPEPYRSRFASRPYDGEIAFVDAEIGRLLAYLSKSHLDERTIVVITGDHGEALGEHGELTHGMLLYEPTLRVPLVVAGVPGTKGRVVREAVSLADLAPTIAKLVSAQLGATDGAPIAALASSSSEEKQPRAIYSETEYPRQFGWVGLTSLRRDHFKLIDSPHPEMYDLAHDPAESRNVYADERRTMQSLRTQLAALRSTEVKETAPSPMDEETRAKLASLGYVGGASPQKSDAERDPKEMLPLFRKFEEAIWRIHDHKFDEARAMLGELVSADPANAVFRSSLARVERQSGHYQEAIRLYRDIVAATPDDADGWYNLAVCLQEAGRGKEALVAVREAIRHDDRRAEAHNTLGIALLGESDLEGSQREFARAIELDPHNARAYNNLGNVLRQMNRLDEADAAYRTSARLAPDYADPINGLGTLAVQRDRPQDAIGWFDRALVLAPADYEIHLNRGIALELLGRKSEAVSEYRRFLSETSRQAEYASQREAARQLLARLSSDTNS
jgi:arylsulfatase A-like enzyme/Tfp pilus assembly protein PilF